MLALPVVLLRSAQPPTAVFSEADGVAKKRIVTDGCV